MTVTQQIFHAAMLDAAVDVPDGLSDAQGRPAGRRFSVYRNNIAVSLTDALQTGFPVIAKLLGDANFKPIAGLFLRAEPPKSALMMHYGAGFPGFLDGFAPLAHLKYLRDVARAELALRRSYHATDSDPISANALAEIAPEDLPSIRMTFAPAMQVLTSQWPVYDIWAYNTFADHPKPRASAQDILITRPEFDPNLELLPAGGASFIAALELGHSLGEAAALATETTPDFDLGSVLALLLTGNAITSLVT